MTNPTQSETLLREALVEARPFVAGAVTRADRTAGVLKGMVRPKDILFEAKAALAKIDAALQSIPEPLLTAQEEADLVDQINGSYYLQPNPEPLLDEGPVMRSDLVERLRRKRRVLHDADRLHSTLELINPDGPEAAKVIERLREDLAKIAVTGVKVPTRSACINIARAAIEAMTASVIDEGLLALNQIADGDYDVLAANPHRWPCMIARKALGLPLQQRYYEAHKAALANQRDEP